MELTLYNYVTISDKFKKIIQSGNYERIVLDVMEASNKFFPSSYEHIEKQSNGECDIVDIKTGEKYDAKLPLESKQGKLIGSNSGDLEKWLKSMIDEVAEFDKFVSNRGNYNAENFRLYKIMSRLISTTKNDENIIFLIPYIVTFESEDMFYTQFASDILSVVFRELKTNGIVADRKIYAIYPSIDKDIVIRYLNANTREFVPNNKLREYIDFSVMLVK